MTSQAVQQYVRIAFYYIFGALATYGMTVPDATKTLIISIAGVLANLAWTIYGTRLNGLLEQIKEKSGVEEIQVKVDPAIIAPSVITDNTSPGITAKPAN